MKTILLLFALTCVLPPFHVGAKELTREEALKIGRDNDGIGNGKFWFEKGDASPPFTHSSFITISKGSAVYLVTNGKDASMVDAPHEDGGETQVDFFTSSKGQGWVTAHILKPEVAVKHTEPPKDERPAEHRYLSSAAELALAKDDTVFLKSLFKRGLLINEALNFEKGNTLLHEAAWSKPEMVRFLLKNGARSDIRDRSGGLPIHAAIARGNKEICNLLAKKSGGDEKKIDGIPAELIAELLPHDEAKLVYFISWNDQDPSPGLLAEIVKTLPNARPKSKMKTLERRPQGASSSYQDTDTQEFGRLIQIDLHEVKDHWTASIRNTGGPALSGGGQEFKLRKAYGYWYDYDIKGWDE